MNKSQGKWHSGIDFELLDTTDDLQCAELLRGLVLLLSYLHADMTFLLIKRNCFYRALTEIWVIA